MASTLSGTSSGLTKAQRKNLKKEDEFTHSVKSVFDKIEDNGRTTVIIIGVAVLAAAGATFYWNSKQEKGQKARDALFLAESSLERETKALTPPPPAPVKKDGKEIPSAPAPSIAHQKMDVDAKFPDSTKQFKELTEKFKGTHAAFESNLKLGDLYFDHGDPSKALTYYNAAVEQAPNSAEKSLALYSAGYALENAGKNAEAIQTYQKALQEKDTPLKGDLLLATARNYELTHDVANARKTYDQILSQLPNTEFSHTAETLKGKLE